MTAARGQPVRILHWRDNGHPTLAPGTKDPASTRPGAPVVVPDSVGTRHDYAPTHDPPRAATTSGPRAPADPEPLLGFRPRFGPLRRGRRPPDHPIGDVGRELHGPVDHDDRGADRRPRRIAPPGRHVDNRRGPTPVPVPSTALDDRRTPTRDLGDARFGASQFDAARYDATAHDVGALRHDSPGDHPADHRSGDLDHGLHHDPVGHHHVPLAP